MAVSWFLSRESWSGRLPFNTSWWQNLMICLSVQVGEIKMQKLPKLTHANQHQVTHTSGLLFSGGKGEMSQFTTTLGLIFLHHRYCLEWHSFLPLKYNVKTHTEEKHKKKSFKTNDSLQEPFQKHCNAFLERVFSPLLSVISFEIFSSRISDMIIHIEISREKKICDKGSGENQIGLWITDHIIFNILCTFVQSQESCRNHLWRGTRLGVTIYGKKMKWKTAV